MLTLDTIAIEQQARRLRAEEMHRLQGAFFARTAGCGHFLAGSLRSSLAEIASVLRALLHPHSGADRIRHSN